MKSLLSALVSRSDGRSVFVITGPTAVGKSLLGAEFADMIGGEVVSADSMQVYKLMDIGTAKPPVAEMRGVRHHMLDIVPPWEDYSVARYVSDAAHSVDGILMRGKKAVIVGGTGLYIDSLLAGRVFSAKGDASLRRELESEYDAAGGSALLRLLGEFDPQAAARLHPNDKKRIVRAIEVFKTTGRPVSESDNESAALPPRYDAAKFALTVPDRGLLYERIDRRVDAMIGKGFEDEVRGLLDIGVPSAATAMQAIGYKEMAEALYGEYSVDEAILRIKTESRRYAKRQLTWLRSQYRSSVAGPESVAAAENTPGGMGVEIISY